MAIQVPVKKGVPYLLEADDNPTFEGWMKRVNHYLWGIGLTADDLPDCTWRDWFDDRVRPIRAANKALKAAGADLF